MTVLDDDTLPTDDGAVLAQLRSAVARHGALAVVDWAGASDVGRVRAANEDAWGQRHQRVFVVADGMGGRDGGQIASTVAVDAFLAASDPAPESWTDAVARVNIQVHAAAEASEHPEAGTTLVAVAVDDGFAVVLAVGDSRVYRLRDGRLELLTTDHNVATAMREAGVDPDVEAAHGTNVGALTSYLGIARDRLVVDTQAVEVAAGDRFLLCSDGVHAFVDEAATLEALSGWTCRDAVDELLRLADAAGGRDNATAVVVDVGVPGPAPSTPR